MMDSCITIYPNSSTFPSKFRTGKAIFGFLEMLPAVRYIEFPSYSGYSIIPFSIIFTKPGSPDFMLQSMYPFHELAIKKN